MLFCCIGAYSLSSSPFETALTAGFIWDDDRYVTENPFLRDANGLAKIWFQVGATVQYYPLVFTTFWVEYHLWGLRPFPYHLTNVLIHALSQRNKGSIIKSAAGQLPDTLLFHLTRMNHMMASFAFPISSFDETKWRRDVENQKREMLYAPHIQDGRFFNPWMPMERGASVAS
jgi:hypothetical protein